MAAKKKGKRKRQAFIEIVVGDYKIQGYMYSYTIYKYGKEWVERNGKFIEKEVLLDRVYHGTLYQVLNYIKCKELLDSEKDDVESFKKLLKLEKKLLNIIEEVKEKMDTEVSKLIHPQ